MRTKTIKERMKWLLKSLIAEDEISDISIEYILLRAETEFNKHLEELRKRSGN